MKHSRKQQAAIAISKRKSSGGTRGMVRPTAMSAALIRKQKEAAEAKAKEAVEAKAKEEAEVKNRVDNIVATTVEEDPTSRSSTPPPTAAQKLAARKAPVPAGVLTGLSSQVKPGYYGVQPAHGLGRSVKRSRKLKRKTRRHRR